MNNVIYKEHKGLKKGKRSKVGEETMLRRWVRVLLTRYDYTSSKP